MVLGKADYLQEAERQLGNGSHYRLLDVDPLDETVGVVKLSRQRFMARMPERSSTSTHSGSSCLERPGWQVFICCLRFISLDIQEGQLCCQTTRRRKTSRSMHVDHFLQPLVRQQPGILRGTTGFLNRLETLPTWKDGWLLVTLDVSSLYTNIPHEEGIEACRSVLNQRSVCDPPPEFEDRVLPDRGDPQEQRVWTQQQVLSSSSLNGNGHEDGPSVCQPFNPL